MTFSRKRLPASQGLFFLVFLISVACASEPKEVVIEKTPAEMIVDSAIAYHGGEIYNNLKLSFSFRDRDYGAFRKNGLFEYTRVSRDSTGEYIRVVNNDGFSETLNSEKISHTSKDSIARAGSVNSVVYFALLPGLLNDPGAIKTLDGSDEIDGINYHRIKVTFNPENGGEDHEDVYLYWFDKDAYRMDYLAYSYHTEEAGTRFRKAMHSRRINGLVFQDYENFRGPANTDSLMFVMDLYKRGELELLSTIELNRIHVAPADSE